MSTVEGAGQRDEGEYGRAAKRLKTEERETEAEEREEGEEELEEGEDSDSGSLPGNGESAVDNRARWSAGQYGVGRRVGEQKYYLTLPCSTASQTTACMCALVRLLPLSFSVLASPNPHTTGYFMSPFFLTKRMLARKSKVQCRQQETIVCLLQLRNDLIGNNLHTDKYIIGNFFLWSSLCSIFNMISYFQPGIYCYLCIKANIYDEYHAHITGNVGL